MSYRYKRERSEFWVTIHENENDSCTITTTEKYVTLINQVFPLLKMISPAGWRKSYTYPELYNLWLPCVSCNFTLVNNFKRWCECAIEDMLWLGKNKNIENFFDNELDFCIATDFNFHYGADRTEMGEAEYNLKYNFQNLNKEQEHRYTNVINCRMLECAQQIPIYRNGEWLVSPMPATLEGRNKMAWRLAETLAANLELNFIEPSLRCQKPQMKQLTVLEKINVWKEIYSCGNVILKDDIIGKNIILIDDLYQSGATMWQYAKYLKQLGAKSVWGLVCVKSLKDSDNR